MSTNECEVLLLIKQHVLKVHINCYGCMQKVKRVLRRIEGVYSVNIDGEHQKVTVSGNIDAATLLNKLAKIGKHAEIWSPRANHNQIQEITDNNAGQMQWTFIDRGLEDQWPHEGYPNQIMGLQPLIGEIDQNSMAEAEAEAESEMEYAHTVDDGDHSFYGDGNMHSYNMVGIPSYHVNGTDLAGLGGHHHGYGGFPAYEYQHPSSMMMNNMQYMHNINRVMNDNMYMQNSQMRSHTSFPRVPPNSHHYYNFISAPHPDN